MTPARFISKWSKSELKERSACQEHFTDLCRLVGQPTPAEADPLGTNYCFERFAEKLDGRDGFADVWKKGCFAIEYKGKRKNLGAAYEQLLQYREDLENPPLLVVCDTDRLIIHTNFTNTAKKTYELSLDNLAEPASLELLRAMFTAPEKLRPGTTVAYVSEEAARKVAALARSLETRGHSPMVAAHFVMKLIFALFAEDTDLLPEGLVEELLGQALRKPALAKPLFEKLFVAMRDGDEGLAFTQEIPHFNGGLFEDATALDLEAKELEMLQAAAQLDWSSVDPAIFGNLYEYGLGDESRSKRGVHYTGREDILHLIEPVLLRPWRKRWESLRDDVAARLAEKPKAKALATLHRRIEEFREALGRIQILDPACGSGNFLVVAMQRLLDLELDVARFQAEWFHVQALQFHVGPQQLHGIELLDFPHALASVVVWIGHLQWLRQHGYRVQERPILKKLHPIVKGDSLELDWPAVDVIIGNPPFIGSKRLRTALGDANVDALFATWQDRVPHEADYVCYWFEKARAAVETGKAKRVGLLATNSIRQGKNRVVLERILAGSGIFFAESDRDWVLEGAAVRVSMVGFGAMEAGEVQVLDGQTVAKINADLTNSVDLSNVIRLRDNKGICFQGPVKVGPFDVPGILADDWRHRPLNPNGKPNSDVLRPWANGIDITRRPQGMWIIDFGSEMSEIDASYYQEPFEYVRREIRPARIRNADRIRREFWWRLGRSGNDFKRAANGLHRVIATTRHAKHRIFAWLPGDTIPDSALIAFASDQDAMFGLLHSRIHEIWALAMCSFIGVGNDARYTPNTTFETFPFPEEMRKAEKKMNRDEGDEKQKQDPSLSPSSLLINLSSVAARLNEARERWLNPEGASEAELKKRTLTNLYNEREAGRCAWLNHLHRELDTAVLALYGWGDLGPALFAAEDTLRAANAKGEALGLKLGRTAPGQVLLERLLTLNLERAGGSATKPSGEDL